MDNFDVVKEFVHLVFLRGTNTGVDILNTVLQWLEKFALDLMWLCSVTTGGTPAMLCKQKGFVVLIKHCCSLGFMQDIKTLRCIVHRETLRQVCHDHRRDGHCCEGREPCVVPSAEPSPVPRSPG